MYGSSIGALKVYMVDKDSKSTLVWSKSGDQGNQWNEAKFTLESKLDYKVGQRIRLSPIVVTKQNKIWNT